MWTTWPPAWSIRPACWIGVIVSVPAEVLNSSGLAAAEAVTAKESAQSRAVILMDILYAVRLPPRRLLKVRFQSDDSPNGEKHTMKSKTRLFLIAVGAIALVWGTVRIVSTRAGRTRSYFAAYHSSYAHAPASIRPYFALADFVLNPVFETFGPFEPVWMQLEPGMKMELDPYDLVSRKILETGEWEPESVR